MNAPFFKFGLFGDETSLIVACAIGIGFGFFLEQAGFGSAKKLTDQFYFKDMAVFRVMFTAIVTAMLGLFYLAAVGWVDLSLVYIQPTYLWPQIVGGLLLGVGFVVGGYCPGTSLVALATGKVDALVFVAGICRRHLRHRRGLAVDHRLHRIVEPRPPDAARGLPPADGADGLAGRADGGRRLLGRGRSRAPVRRSGGEGGEVNLPRLDRLSAQPEAGAARGGARPRSARPRRSRSPARSCSTSASWRRSSKGSSTMSPPTSSPTGSSPAGRTSA